MSQRVNLPPGCSGFDAKDGTKYKANKPGGSVVISDRHAAALDSSQYADQGFISAKGAVAFGTRQGMVCAPCIRTWNAWNTVCPSCGGVTVPEHDLDSA